MFVSELFSISLLLCFFQFWRLNFQSPLPQQAVRAEGGSVAYSVYQSKAHLGAHEAADNVLENARCKVEKNAKFKLDRQRNSTYAVSFGLIVRRHCVVNAVALSL
jgi:hypothetical protein